MTDVMVSIIITFYNKKKFAKTCIESVLNQSYEKLQIILVDDGSTDGTDKILDDYMLLDKRVEVIHQSNSGLSEARVVGIEKANGVWIIIVDGDDYLSTDFVSEHLKVALTNTDIEIVSANRFYLEIPETCVWPQRSGRYKLCEGKRLANNIYTDSEFDRPLVCKLIKLSYIRKFDLRKYKDQCPMVFFEDCLFTPFLIYYAKVVAIIPDKYWVHRNDITSVSRAGLLNDFHFDQVMSGAILLRFLQNKQLYNTYSFFVEYYYRLIIKIWCLIDYYDLEEDYKTRIKNNIIRNYWIYYEKYLEYSNNSRRFIYFSVIVFGFARHLFKKMILLTYYRGYEKKKDERCSEIISKVGQGNTVFELH